MPKSNWAALVRKRELHGNRIVEPQLLPQAQAILERGVLPNHLVDGVADEAEQREGDEGHRHHDDGRLEEPTDGECEHLPLSKPLADGCRGGGQTPRSPPPRSVDLDPIASSPSRTGSDYRRVAPSLLSWRRPRSATADAAV